MKIVLEPGYDHREELGALFAEYTQMLLEKKPDFGGYLEQQGYDTELDHLRDKYGPPDGCLYLATVDGQAAGCMALRKISDKEAELKRLYVRPQFRHLGVAQKLVDQILGRRPADGLRGCPAGYLPLFGVGHPSLSAPRLLPGPLL